METRNLDHLVLTVEDIDRTCDFYTRVLGMKKISPGADRKFLGFGNQKINLHQRGKELRPAAKNPTQGSTDLCFITAMSMTEVISRLEECGVEILEGPVTRTGANGPLESIYFRDPDGNLLEISVKQTIFSAAGRADQPARISASRNRISAGPHHLFQSIYAAIYRAETGRAVCAH